MDERGERIRRYFTVDHLTMREIGRLEGISGAAVCKRLARLGIIAKQGTQVTAQCATCGQSFQRTRARWRQARRLFCSSACYMAARRNPSYKPSRHHGRIARQLVAQHFTLEREHVVHHVNADQTDNRLSNLWVFASQLDHMRHHHGSVVVPIWRGDAI